jgi:hypothetical protein
VIRLRFVAFLAFAAAAAAAPQDRPDVRGGTTQDPPVSESQGNGKTRIVPGEAGANPAMGRSNNAAAYDSHASLRAQLLKPEEYSRRRAAAVKVTVTGVRLVDPDSVNDKAQPGQGHLAYRVDMGPVVATATRLTFSRLPKGRHEILVELVANDDTPLGPHDVKRVDIP